MFISIITRVVNRSKYLLAITIAIFHQRSGYIITIVIVVVSQLMRFYHHNIYTYTYLQPQLYSQIGLVDVFAEATLRGKQSKQFWETDEKGKIKQ